jgi:hypothetical protein
MAVATINSHIYDAIRLQALHGEAYMAFGKQSSWPDDENPPVEDPNTASLSEVIGYKKVRKFSLARPLAAEETTSYPTVTYKSMTWALIPVDKAYDEKAYWVYIDAEVNPGELPEGQYRQVGVQVGLKPKAGVTKENLLPSEVEDPGTLRLFSNLKPTNLTSSSTSLEQFVFLA